MAYSMAATASQAARHTKRDELGRATLRTTRRARLGVAIVAKLTLAAKRQLVLCGIQEMPMASVTALQGPIPRSTRLMPSSVYDGCDTGENKWYPARGDLYPFLERLVRRLVTDDKKKYSKRAPAMSFENLDAEPVAEQASAIYLNSLYGAADEETQVLILAVQEHMNDTGGVNWGDVQSTLGVTKYEMNKRREKLASLMEKHDLLHPQAQPDS